MVIMKEIPTSEELTQAAMPLLELLNKYYHPYAYAVVTEGSAQILEGDIGVLLPVRD